MPTLDLAPASSVSSNDMEDEEGECPVFVDRQGNMVEGEWIDCRQCFARRARCCMFTTIAKLSFLGLYHRALWPSHNVVCAICCAATTAGCCQLAGVR